MINLVTLLYQVLSRALEIYSILMIVYILMSWFPGAYGSKIGQLLARICEPYLDVFRRIIPPIGMISVSGIVAIFVLQLAQSGLFALYRIIISLLIN